MREQLALVLPEVRTLPGTAERIPLEEVRRPVSDRHVAD